MPRSNLCIPEEHIVTEKAIKWLCRQEKQKEIAKRMGMSEQLFSYKKKTTSFTLEEFIQALHSVNATETDLKMMLY